MPEPATPRRAATMPRVFPNGSGPAKRYSAAAAPAGAAPAGPAPAPASASVPGPARQQPATGMLSGPLTRAWQILRRIARRP